MKICFLGDAGAHHLRRWAKYFANKGHEVHVVTFNANILDNYGQIKVHFVKKWIDNSMLVSRILNVPPMITRLKALLKDINPDIIHSHSVGGYAYMVAASGVHPFIVTPWGSDVLIDIQNSRIEKYFTTLVLKKADAITCDGENTREIMINLGIPSKKIKFITFGVDIQKFKPSTEKEYSKKKLLLPNSKIVISTRTLNPIHNVETFIRSIHIVLKSNPDTKFIIVGDGSEREYLINLAQSLNVNNAIRFLGKIEEEQMITALQASDIYVSTSLSESGLAASTAEAMACELPVINTDTGDIRLWIKAREGGFIIPTRNPETLAEKISYLLNNNEMRMQFGKKNRRIIEERNNYYLEMEKMENIYKELVSRYDG